MGTLKQTTRRLKGKAKEAIAEVLGDGKLQEGARIEQGQGEEETTTGSPILSSLESLNRPT